MWDFHIFEEDCSVGMTPCQIVKKNDLHGGTGSTLLPNSVQFQKIKKSTQKMKTGNINWDFVNWLKRDQLEVTFFIISLFNAQHVSNVSTSILRSLRLIYWVISWVVLLWFYACWCYGVLQPPSGYHTTPAEPHRNTNTHRTRAIQHMK